MSGKLNSHLELLDKYSGVSKILRFICKGSKMANARKVNLVQK